MKLFYFILSMLTGALSVFAQEVSLELPFYKNKEVALLLKQGVISDTLTKITLDKEGKAKIKYEITGSAIGTLFIKTITPAVSFDFILSPNEKPYLFSKEEHITAMNTQVSNSVENKSINKWFEKKTTLELKQSTIKQLLGVYSTKDSFYQSLIKEQNKLNKQQQVFQDSLNTSSLYAAHYIKYRDLLEQVFSKTWESDTARNLTRKTLTEEINIDALYGSGMWFDLLNGSIESYIKYGPNYEKLGDDYVGLLKKTQSNKAFNDLADAAISICETFSWHKDKDALVNYLINSNRITNPTGRLKKILQMQQSQIGKIAPNLFVPKVNTTELLTLKSDELSTKHSLILFHESGCGNCENTINQLIGNYDYLNKEGFRIISIASDMEETTFLNTSNKFPWKDKYCDYKGFEGINFKNYGIIGTPSMFILNKEGKIVHVLSTLQEVLDWINTKNVIQ